MPADTLSEIVVLQAEFQHIADLHPWVSLAIPKRGAFQIGELVRPSAPPPLHSTGKILDSNGQPIILRGPSLEERAAYCKAVGAVRFSDKDGREREPSLEEAIELVRFIESEPDRMFDLYGPPPWVMEPRDGHRRAIVEHVKALTWRANKLLLRALDAPNQIPADIRQEIRERERECIEHGWLRWLWFTTTNVGRRRIENYPQVAATALRSLRETVSDAADGMVPPATPPAAGSATNPSTDSASQFAETADNKDSPNETASDASKPIPDDEAQIIVRTYIDSRERAGQTVTARDVAASCSIALGRVPKMTAWMAHQARKAKPIQVSKPKERQLTQKMLGAIGVENNPAARRMSVEEAALQYLYKNAKAADEANRLDKMTPAERAEAIEAVIEHFDD